MQLAEVEAQYRSNWLDAERVESARSVWQVTHHTEPTNNTSHERASAHP